MITDTIVGVISDHDFHRSGQRVVAIGCFSLVQIIFRMVIKTLDGDLTVIRSGHGISHGASIIFGGNRVGAISICNELDQFSLIGFSRLAVRIRIQSHITRTSESEHGAFQCFAVICAINLGHINLERPVVDRLFRGLASTRSARIVAVHQICFVLLRTIRAYLSLFVQNARIISVKAIACLNNVGVSSSDDINKNGKGVSIGSNGIITRIQNRAVQRIANLNGNIRISLDVRGQLRGHRIVNLIGVVSVTGNIGNSGNGAELNGITDLVVAHNTPAVGIIVIDFLVELDRGIFCIDRFVLQNAQHITAVGSTFGQASSCVLDEVVAVRQAANSIIGTSRRNGIVLRNAEMVTNNLSKGVNIGGSDSGIFEFGSEFSGCISALQRSGQVAIRANSFAVNAVTPLDVAQNAVVQLTFKHLIGFIGADCSRTVNRKSVSSTSGSSAIICPHRRCHGANHSNCQQHSHEFLHCFFHGKSPFLFCPLPPPAFCTGGGRGVVLFGLSRKLCAGRAGAQPRASGREVQFSHLPSLRVCACGG